MRIISFFVLFTFVNPTHSETISDLISERKNTLVSISKDIAKRAFEFEYGLKLSESENKILSFVEGDFTCDGVNDIFVYADNRMHLQGEVFEVLLVSGQKGTVRSSGHYFWYLEKGKGTSSHTSLVLPSPSKAAPSVKVFPFSKDKLACENAIYIGQAGAAGFLIQFKYSMDPFTKKMDPSVSTSAETEAGSGVFITKQSSNTI